MEQQQSTSSEGALEMRVADVQHWRTAQVQAKTELDLLREAFNAEHEGLINEVKAAGTAVDMAESDLRAFALEEFEANGREEKYLGGEMK